MRIHDPSSAAGRRYLVAAALALALLGRDAARARDKVVVSLHFEIYAADLVIAIEEGYFAAQGLDVEIVAWSNSTAMLPALAHGEIDFSSTSSLSPSYINLIQRGAPIRLVAARSVHQVGACPYVAFVARSELIDSGRLSDLASLRGLRIATTRTAPSFYYWARLLDRAGLTTDDVVLKGVPDDLKVEAIARDLVDVATTIEPKVTRLVELGRRQGLASGRRRHARPPEHVPAVRSAAAATSGATSDSASWPRTSPAGRSTSRARPIATCGSSPRART